MLVSVIVPVYNTEKYLRECLDSIINQTYKNIEIILVDDGSTDVSGAICDEYALTDNRINVLHISNGGVSNARNLGIDNAHGEYIMFVDADDIIMPYIVERGVNIAVCNNADIVYGLVQTFKNKATVKNVLNGKQLLLSGDAIKKLATNMFDLHDSTFKNYVGYINRGPCSRLIKKSYAKRNKFNVNLALGEDGVWNLNLLRDIKECVVDMNLWYRYRIVDESASHRYRESAKNDFSNMMIAHLSFVKFFSAEQFCFNRAWESICEVCDKYYLNIIYPHSFLYATKDLNKYLLEYPWNTIFCFSWACKNGAKGIVKWILLKCNLVLLFKLAKNRLKGAYLKWIKL